MNAKETAFADSFDLDCGSSILHHLNLNKACAEIRRILSAQPFISGCGAIPEVEDFSRDEEHFAAGR